MGLAVFKASKWPSFQVDQLRAEPETVLAGLDDAGLDVAPVNWAQEAGSVAGCGLQQYVAGMADRAYGRFLPGLDSEKPPGNLNTHIEFISGQ